jgi:integrase
MMGDDLRRYLMLPALPIRYRRTSMNLTDDSVKKLVLPPDGPDGKVYFDDRISGLGVRCYRSGRKTWLYQFRLAGRSYKHEIGSTATILASKARAEAKIAAGHVAKGENPIDLRRQAETKHKDQFGELVEDYLDEKLHPIKPGKKPMRPRSHAEVKRHLEDHCKPFRYRAIRGITQDDVAGLYKKISRASGSGAASHTWSSLRAFMHWGMGKGVLDKNVAALYDGGGANEPRERTLDDSEIAIVWKACRDDQFGNIVKILLLTGARRDEVGHMHLSELDLIDKTWLIPEDRAKNWHEHLVPVSDAAVDILTKSTETREAFVFGHGEKRGFSGWSKAKKALDKRIAEAGHTIEHWQIHDLRRTFCSGLQRLKIEPHVIDACINHLPPKLQRTYQTHGYEDERRTALARWADHVLAIVEGRENNVIPLKRVDG